jgi:hypothetical protein
MMVPGDLKFRVDPADRTQQRSGLISDRPCPGPDEKHQAGAANREKKTNLSFQFADAPSVSVNVRKRKTRYARRERIHGMAEEHIFGIQQRRRFWRGFGFRRGVVDL